MKRNLISVITLLATSTLVGISSPANAKPSSYHKSCNNISVHGNILSANCSRPNGTVNQTGIVLRGIENVNGTLKVTKLGKFSNYQLSCSNIHSRGNVLLANCRRINGTAKRTSIVLQGIENINGVLKYTSSP